MKTFQQPLTAEEEAYYIRMLREGTVEEARQAKEILVERNLRLVAHIAKKYQNVEEGNAIHLLDVIEEKQRDVVEDLEFLRNRKRLLVALDHCLTEREYKILVMRYGILGYKEYTQQEVGDVLGISRSYVSRMEKRALQKLAAELKEE